MSESWSSSRCEGIGWRMGVSCSASRSVSRSVSCGGSRRSSWRVGKRWAQCVCGRWSRSVS
jgi:hypothetical protein